MHEYEEYHEWSTTRSWLFIFGLVFFLIVMMSSMMLLVKDVPREWDFGNIEFTPAKSKYSTANPEPRTSKKMIAPLPEGLSMEEENELKSKKSENK